MRRIELGIRASMAWFHEHRSSFNLVQFAATHAGEYHSFMVSHSVHGATVRPVVVNRLEASLLVAPELDQEITIRLKRDEALGGRL